MDIQKQQAVYFDVLWEKVKTVLPVRERNKYHNFLIGNHVSNLEEGIFKNMRRYKSSKDPRENELGVLIETQLNMRIQKDRDKYKHTDELKARSFELFFENISTNDLWTKKVYDEIIAFLLDKPTNEAIMHNRLYGDFNTNVSPSVRHLFRYRFLEIAKQYPVSTIPSDIQKRQADYFDVLWENLIRDINLDVASDFLRFLLGEDCQTPKKISNFSYSGKSGDAETVLQLFIKAQLAMRIQGKNHTDQESLKAFYFKIFWKHTMERGKDILHKEKIKRFLLGEDIGMVKKIGIWLLGGTLSDLDTIHEWESNSHLVKKILEYRYAQIMKQHYAQTAKTYSMVE